MGILNDFNKRKGFRWEKEEGRSYKLGQVFQHIIDPSFWELVGIDGGEFQFECVGCVNDSEFEVGSVATMEKEDIPRSFDIS